MSSTTTPAPLVGIIMGSKSDLHVMQAAATMLQTLEVPFELQIVSAHRTPERMVAYAKAAEGRGLKVVIAGAGGAAHLPGMVASLTLLPVIGVPVKSAHSLDGWDSILSILQMPGGISVATVALNNAKNAALLAAQILSLSDGSLLERLRNYRKSLTDAVLADVETIDNKGFEALV
jgi:5-(carboxyamino)imidazole ribonucleotide mutase